MGRMLEQLMEFEVSNRVGAERHERNSGRQTYRNGYRERPLHTRLGTLELQVPCAKAVIFRRFWDRAG